MLALVTGVLILCPSVGAGMVSSVRKVSVGTDGTQANGESGDPVISPCGRFVAFESDATNLVPEDTNGFTDIFVHDLQTGQTARASVGEGGTEANGWSRGAGISTDGRFVVFHSAATNLVAPDTNGEPDVFARDLRDGRTIRVSSPVSGGQADGPSLYPAISADGRFVAFESFASNLVQGGSGTGRGVFVHDLQSGTTARISMESEFRKPSGRTWLPGSVAWSRPALSTDGRYVALVSWVDDPKPGSSIGVAGVFVLDRSSGGVTLASRSSGGVPGNRSSYFPSLSGDGRFTVFQSTATNLDGDVDREEPALFLHDQRRGTTIRVGAGLGGGLAGTVALWSPSLSGDGRVIACAVTSVPEAKESSNSRSEVWLLDLEENRAVRVDVALDGGAADGPSRSPSLSLDGTRVAFASHATNLVPADTNAVADVFLVTRARETPASP